MDLQIDQISGTKMPLYDYRCEDCKEVSEHLLKAEHVPPPCKRCGSLDTKMVIGLTDFRLKGSGWYETDFKDSATGSSQKRLTDSREIQRK